MSRDIDERCWWCDEDLEGQVLTEHIKKHPVTKFEAEVSSMVSVAGFCDHFCCDLPANVCRVRTLAREIERFLAAEREPMECGHPKACLVEREITNIEKNEGPLDDTEYCSACAERERVREMCAEIPKIWGFKAIDSEVFKSEGIRTVVIGMCDFIEREIRQLDLTALDDKEGK